MKKIVIVSIIGLFLSGCELVEHAQNRENLNKIKIGMSMEEVKQIMGKPYRREAQDQTEWWLYPTDEKTIFSTESDYHTPLVFENNKLIGWGKNFWTTKEQKYDIKIDQKIKKEE
jgi:outer membrane protein assembly factor BamE (lipoprotein component of BamABCDE complex)